MFQLSLLWKKKIIFKSHYSIHLDNVLQFLLKEWFYIWYQILISSLWHFLYMCFLNKDLRFLSYNLQKTQIIDLFDITDFICLWNASYSRFKLHLTFPQYPSNFQLWLPIYLIPPLFLFISITFAALPVLEVIRKWAKWGSRSEIIQCLCLWLPVSFVKILWQK